MKPMAAAVVLAAAGGGAFAEETTAAGAAAIYRLQSSRHDRPSPADSVRLRIGPAQDGLRWWSLEIDPAGEAAPFRAVLLSETVPGFGGARAPGRIARYLLEDAPGRLLEYVDAETGGALLPEFDFVLNCLPVPGPGVEITDGFARTARLLGHLLILQETARSAPGDPEAFLGGKPTVLRMDRGMLVGTGRNFRNAKPGRLTDPAVEYEYVRFTRADYDEMIAAGVNVFNVDAEQESWIANRPVFWVTGDPAARYPLALYRSSYMGMTQFLDEPAVYITGNQVAKDNAHRPTDLARTLEAWTRSSLLGGNDYYSRRYVAQVLAAAKVNLGDMDLADRDIPVWETVIETACYELAGGADGVIQEARYSPKDFLTFCRSLLGAEAEAGTAEMLALDVATLRGAARVHGKDWGIAIYGQADPAVSPDAVTRAYDAGARYVWYWTSDHGHHLPYEEQLDLTRRLRTREAGRPRGDRKALLRAAKVAVAIPDGAALGLPWVSWLPPRLALDADLPGGGGTYRQALQGALREALRLAREGTSFDLVVDGEMLGKAGYEQVLRPWLPPPK